MKKKLMVVSLLFAFFVCMSVGFNVNANELFIEEVEPREETVFAGSAGGTWYIAATAFFDIFSSEIDGIDYTIQPGGGVTNPVQIGRGNGNFAMGYTTNLFETYTGESEAADQPYENLRGIANLNNPALLHAFVLPRIEAETISDLAGQSFNVDAGPRGTGGELAASRVLSYHGVSYDDIDDAGGTVTFSSYGDAADRLRDGHIDVFLNDDVIGAPAFVELVQARNVKILSLDEDIIKELEENYGYDPMVIPAGTYPNQEEDVLTIAQHHVFHTHKDTPEDLVYTMTKLIFENKERLREVHGYFDNLSLEVGPQGWPEEIELHPGARKYYEEAGVL